MRIKVVLLPVGIIVLSAIGRQVGKIGKIFAQIDLTPWSGPALAISAA